jgi:hypothetical protein
MRAFQVLRTRHVHMRLVPHLPLRREFTIETHIRGKNRHQCPVLTCNASV